MSEEYAIEVHDVRKSFRVYLDKGFTLKESLLSSKRRKYSNREVLKGISFKVKKGEAIGLIGHNGCGKSTTLKLLARIMYPDQGTITMNGRVSSLIELGAGFHPDMSGRQNIYINASIFGLTKSEIDRRVNDIIEFSELKEFIDNPVRTYSSGMYMRLAFAVAINVDASILLIDEILAVGDANFQVKCFNRLREIKNNGVTIVLVSHDMSSVESFCDTAVWLNNGDMIAYGKSVDVVDSYLKYMNEQMLEGLNREQKKQSDRAQQPKRDESTMSSISHSDSKNDSGDVVLGESVSEGELRQEIDYSANHFGIGGVTISNAVIRNSVGEEVVALRAGDDYAIEIHYKNDIKADGCVFGIGIYTMDKNCLMGSNTQLDNCSIATQPESGVVSCKLANLQLLTGQYILNVAIVDESGVPYDFYRDYMHFRIISDDRSSGYVSISHSWQSGGQ